MKSKVEIIDETAEFYGSDPSRRALGSISCMYEDEKGNRCAVGRCFTEEAIKVINERNWHNKNVAMLRQTRETKDVIPCLFKEEYEGYISQFWNELQDFHDKPIYWDEEGITQEGLQYVKHLKEKYALEGTT